MTIVSNDPSWWPLINSNIVLSYWIVAASAVVVYDWILSLGKEIELIWRQCWSLMTLLYLVIRYIGLLYYVLYILRNMPSVSLTDVVSIPQLFRSHPMDTLISRGDIIYYVTDGTDVVVSAMLGVIMIARLHAMYQILYQRSRIVLIFLVIIFLAVYIACGVIAAIALKDTVVEELILSGTYICNYRYEADVQLLASVIWMLITLLEVIALCLSVWIAVEHFRDLRRLGASKGSTIGDCFGVLIKSHVLYFASFACVSCFEFGFLSPELLVRRPVADICL
ncbi:hypothetical protein EV702DRAFT_231270 [Suillus placidus]|uniref:DUF6533 domain-containing protein n=1 Tax=Suillus placidus TaxID=48579 RepID=A0A9P7D8W4_9AGAM|nr:hypothetical protein EV702DRAFT_231270 [Suillus placidus]